MEETIASYNKDANILKLCRTCLTDRGEMKSLFAKKENLKFSPLDILECFVPIKFEIDSNLPSNICASCYAFVDEVNRFKQHCIRSDITLLKHIKRWKSDREGTQKSVSKKESSNHAKLSDVLANDTSRCGEYGSGVTKKHVDSEFDVGNQFNSDGNEVLSKSTLNKIDMDEKCVAMLKDEERVRKIKTYVCRHCDFNSCFKWEYVEHRKITHGKSKRSKSGASLKCLHCEYVTHVKMNLVTHSKTHFGNKPFHCEHCQFRTNFRASLNAHIRIHTGEKPFLCDKCDLRFKQLAHLKQHRLTHSDTRPWPCTRCDYKAKAKRHLDNHLRTHTGEKPYMCDLCSFTCANHVNLLSHKRSHSVEKIFKCSVCPYASNFKKNLSMHVAKHSGVKAFECTVCEYRGTCAQNLRAHMISHSQERPFACVVCAYRTKTNSMLNKHMKTHVR